MLGSVLPPAARGGAPTRPRSPARLRKLLERDGAIAIVVGELEKVVHVLGVQLLVLRSEDVFARPEEALAVAWRFAGLDVRARPPQQREEGAYRPVLPRGGAADAIAAEPMSGATRAILDEFFAPHNADLAHLLGDERFLWRDVRAATRARNGTAAGTTEGAGHR